MSQPKSPLACRLHYLHAPSRNAMTLPALTYRVEPAGASSVKAPSFHRPHLRPITDVRMEAMASPHQQPDRTLKDTDVLKGQGHGSPRTGMLGSEGPKHGERARELLPLSKCLCTLNPLVTSVHPSPSVPPSLTCQANLRPRAPWPNPRQHWPLQCSPDCSIPVLDTDHLSGNPSKC